MAPSPTTSRITSANRLLQLPLEVRKLIWEYVLTMRDGLMYYGVRTQIGRMYSCDITFLPTAGKTPASIRTHEVFLEANKLHRVNRQLRRETKGLHLRYNDITFSNVQELARFIRSCPNSTYKHLRTFILQKSIYHPRTLWWDEQDDEAVQEVFKFCRRAPNVRVRNNVKLNLRSYSFICDAMRLEFTARRTTTLLDTICSPPGFLDADWRYLFATPRIRSSFEGPEPAPRNLRLYPQLLGTDDESVRAFEEAYTAMSRETGSTLKPLKENELLGVAWFGSSSGKECDVIRTERLAERIFLLGSGRRM